MNQFRNLAVGLSFLSLFSADSAFAAAPVRGARNTAAPASAAAPESSAPGVNSARAARAPVAARAAAPAPAAPVVAARSGTTPTSAPKTGAAPVVAARAGQMQSVKSNGTTIAGATKNTAVSEQCKEKYYGCMDSFCMVENDNGGRCVCSNRKAELDTALAEIEKLNTNIVALRTKGVETIEMGAKADAVMSTADAAVKKALGAGEEEKPKSRRRTLDMSSIWEDSNILDVEEIIAPPKEDALSGKRGDALHQTVAEICVNQMRECGSDIEMLQMMYTQQIRSDCSAYENYLKKQKNEAQKTLSVAESEVRAAALESFNNANKYDLGQCVLEYKKCYINTAGCGEDFSGCVGIAAAENAKMSGSNKASMKMYNIKGGSTQISIAASSYDAVLSKKPICDSITSSCMLVRDQVFDAFLREVAPQLKTAELIAESNLRQSCLANISGCFQKACKDTMDPKDPDGSYDMCLSRPEAIRSLCRVQIDPCVQAEPLIMDMVYAKLAAMRVDACTNEVKACFTSENACGENFANCIGLDLEGIKSMCPIEKLTACVKDTTANLKNKTLADYPEAETSVNNILAGIYLQVDNNAFAQCDKIVKTKVAEICGTAETGQGCDAFADDKYLGTESLASYKDKNGDFVITGLMSIGKINIQTSTATDGRESLQKYVMSMPSVSNPTISESTTTTKDGDTVTVKKFIETAANQSTVDMINNSLESIAGRIGTKVAMLTGDTKVGYCVSGRDMSQITGRGKTAPRFPHLLDSYILNIIDSGLEQANKNYTAKLNELKAKALKDQSDEVKSMTCASTVNNAADPICEEWMSASQWLDQNPTNSLSTAIANSAVLNTVFGNEKKICKKWGSGEFKIEESSGDKGFTKGGTEYVISGQKLAAVVNTAARGQSDRIQTDTFGNMMATITQTSNYSAADQTCTIITTTNTCKNAKEVVLTDTKTTTNNGGGGILNLGSFSIGGGSKRVSTTETNQSFEGAVCTEFQGPVVDTQVIKM
ncbi:MAG: hypothetical protein LBJ18_00445 [Rickettsiales bacterium]|jgi:hypothetical protein|nr:hypothetical protein [Rickettsiales bacterium]